MRRRRGRGRGIALDGQLARLIPGAPRTQMQRMVLEHDWAATPLGAEEHWSPTLRTAVSTALNSGFGMLLMWGPELVMIYNDGYAPTLGLRHPAALGRRVPDVWGDVWADIEPMIDDVFAGGTTSYEDLPLTMTRRGFDEECYFTFSYSPVVEPDGEVAGLLNTVVETTQRVLAARRMGVLQQLGSLPRSVHGSTDRAVAAALAVLAEARTDCPFGLVYLVGEDGERARDWSPVTASAPTASSRPASSREQVREAIATGEVQTVTGLAELLPGLSERRREPGRRGRRPHGRRPPARRRRADRRRSARWSSAPARTCSWTTSTGSSCRWPPARSPPPSPTRRPSRPSAGAPRSGRSSSGPGRRSSPRSPSPCSAPSSGRRRCRRTSPSTTSPRAGRWRSAATGTTSSTCPTAATGSSSATSSAAVWPRPRSWASSAAPGGRCCWRAARPAHVLSALDRFAALVPGAAVSTVFCAVIDPRDGTLRYSSAGHPPAIVVGPDGAARFLEAAGSLPLAVDDDRDRPEADVVLAPGSTLLLYTDGLIERRDRDLDDGMARAAAVLAEGRDLAAGGARRRAHREAPGRRPRRRRRLPRLPLGRLSPAGQGSKRYPRPLSVSRCRGRAASASSLRRSVAM